MNNNEQFGVYATGHIKIHDPENSIVYHDTRNAIHFENMSIAIANSLSSGTGIIYEMAFGNGGTSIDETGIITYFTPNNSGSNVSLYNETYNKVIDKNSSSNIDPSRNFMEVRHITGTNYTDIFVTCLLDYGEPSGQSAYDNAINSGISFSFDELGLKAYSPTGDGMLLTHVVFSPVLKSLNRLIQIDYTVRIHTLTGNI